MATQDLYEQWERRVERRGEAKGKAEGKAEGETEGLLLSLVRTYEERFGAMPAPLQTALATKVNTDAIGRWAILFATVPAAEIAAAIHKGKPLP